MNNSFKLFTQCRKNNVIEKAKFIGFASWILMQCRRYSFLRFVDFRVWLIPAIDHKQIIFFFDDYDTPVGYLVWANLAPDSEQRLLNDPKFLLHESEWDEGSSTWIIDCCFLVGGLAFARQELRKLFLTMNIKKLNWVRRNMDYSVKKVSCWNIVAALHTDVGVACFHSPQL
ncbi:toxin-activating lysine-acyltransferase [Pseudomonas trivialis]|uniref:toxin-activating lysine-acyltransferase n=1 Tax=Pseudomonas trivialis TaxID=200450 RepID=UPI0030CFD320